MKTDPTMKRRRGAYVCAQCDTLLNEVTIKNEDPFCSAVCANGHYDFTPTSAMYSLNGRPMGDNQGGGRPQKYNPKEVTA
jgi:hypothetical protein